MPKSSGTGGREAEGGGLGTALRSMWPGGAWFGGLGLSVEGPGVECMWPGGAFLGGIGPLPMGRRGIIMPVATRVSGVGVASSCRGDTGPMPMCQRGGASAWRALRRLPSPST